METSGEIYKNERQKLWKEVKTIWKQEKGILEIIKIWEQGSEYEDDRIIQRLTTREGEGRRVTEEAIRGQRKIGWDQILVGWISSQWAETAMNEEEDMRKRREEKTLVGEILENSGWN